MLVRMYDLLVRMYDLLVRMYDLLVRMYDLLGFVAKHSNHILTSLERWNSDDSVDTVVTVTVLLAKLTVTLQ